MTNPFDNGTGFGFYIILPFMYRYGTGVPVGGSWALAEALQKCFLDSGGTIKLNSTVKQILIQGKEARGVVLEGGEEIHAKKVTLRQGQRRFGAPDAAITARYCPLTTGLL